jgi:hypothetical protein
LIWKEYVRRVNLGATGVDAALPGPFRADACPAGRFLRCGERRRGKKRVKAEEVQDEGSLRRWLESLPRDTPEEEAEARRRAVVIAHRAAMRALPGNRAYRDLTALQERAWLAMPIMRADLVSGVAAIDLALDISAAANAAVAAADALAGAADAAALAAAAAAVRAESDAVRMSEVGGDIGTALAATAVAAFTNLPARAAFWRSVRADCVALEAGEAAIVAPLWSERNPQKADWAALREMMLAMGDGWGFWVDWYENALEGRPQDLELLTEVALIPSEDWEKGAEHVNGLIAEIVARRGREAEAPKPNARTAHVIRQAVAANREAVPLTLEGLLAALDAERERLRGDNALEPELRERLLAIFDRMAEAALGIGSAVPRTGPVDAATAEAIGSWAAVLTQTARHWNLEAKKVVLGQEADARVAMAGRVVLGGAVAGVLTAVGLPAYAAVAGGAILLRDKVSEIGKAIGARLPGSG